MRKNPQVNPAAKPIAPHGGSKATRARKTVGRSLNYQVRFRCGENVYSMLTETSLTPQNENVQTTNFARRINTSQRFHLFDENSDTHNPKRVVQEDGLLLRILWNKEYRCCLLEESW